MTRTKLPAPKVAYRKARYVCPACGTGVTLYPLHYEAPTCNGGDKHKTTSMRREAT